MLLETLAMFLLSFGYIVAALCIVSLPFILLWFWIRGDFKTTLDYYEEAMDKKSHLSA